MNDMFLPDFTYVMMYTGLSSKLHGNASSLIFIKQVKHTQLDAVVARLRNFEMFVGGCSFC